MAHDTQEEKDFRERYAIELRKKKIQDSINPHFGLDELAEEVKNVKHHEQMTPGRRGEQIKYEEISKEIHRHLRLKQTIQLG